MAGIRHGRHFLFCFFFSTRTLVLEFQRQPWKTSPHLSHRSGKNFHCNTKFLCSRCHSLLQQNMHLRRAGTQDRAVSEVCNFYMQAVLSQKILHACPRQIEKWRALGFHHPIGPLQAHWIAPKNIAAARPLVRRVGSRFHFSNLLFSRNEINHQKIKSREIVHPLARSPP